MTQPKKVLLAEDDFDCLDQWIDRLAKRGFDFGGGDSELMGLYARSSLVKLNYGQHELHITASVPVLEKAVAENDYDLCYMDGTLANGKKTYDVTAQLCKKENPPTIVLISSMPDEQISVLLHHWVDVDTMQRSEKLMVSEKNFVANEARLQKTFGWRDGGAPVVSVRGERNRCER